MDRNDSNSFQLLIEVQIQPNPSKHYPQPIPLATAQCACSLCRKEIFYLWIFSANFAVAAGSSTAQYLSRTVGCGSLSYDSGLSTLFTPHFGVSLLSNEELKDKYRCYQRLWGASFSSSNCALLQTAPRLFWYRSLQLTRLTKCSTMRSSSVLRCITPRQTAPHLEMVHKVR